MIETIKKHWPLIIATGVLWLTISVLLLLSILQNQGHFVYALDDPYIHMAIAKNFAQDGIWGISPSEFTSSSSSPLWILMLSLSYFLFGANEVSLFILNFIIVSLVVCVTYYILKKHTTQPIFTFVILLSIIFFTPLVPLVFSGQEHLLHILISIAFVFLSAKILSDEKAASKEYVLLYILTPLVAIARYEGMSLILVVSILFLLRRRLPHSLCIAGLGILPVVIYGVISISNGWYFLPNPILLKANMPDHSSLSGIILSLGSDGLLHLLRTPHILFLTIGSLAVFIFRYTREKNIWSDSSIMNIIFVAITFLHMQFAVTGWFFRYEAYLVALGIFVITIAIRDYIPQKLTFKIDRNQKPKYVAVALVILLLIFPFGIRAIASLKNTPQATSNIYEQQYQTALFLKEFYQGKTVAANDIGAINYLADIKCIDLWGLANFEVATLKREGNYDTQQIYELVKQEKVEIAIVFESWFEEYGGVPTQWVKVGEWEISNNIVVGCEIVSFYAVDPFEEQNLIENLKSFSSRIPDAVMQRGKYTK